MDAPATPLIPPSQARPLAFATPYVLAPMEGVTHRVFRDLIISLGGVGAAWTEFLRVSSAALSTKVILRELGPQPTSCPVGVQLMGNNAELMAETARHAVLAGAPTVDINFGCPAPVVFRHCAGSALLKDPDNLGRLVHTIASAVSVPVTAKIRLGVDDASRLRDIVQAIEGAGAARLTVHARTKADGYTHPARWEWLSKVVTWTRLPVTGNGDVITTADAHRMRHETGVDAVMIGRGVLRDPWIFARLLAESRHASEPQVRASEIRAFHAAYRDAILADGGEGGVVGQLKQWWRRFDGGLALTDADRNTVLRASDLAALDAAVESLLTRAELVA